MARTKVCPRCGHLMPLRPGPCDACAAAMAATADADRRERNRRYERRRRDGAGREAAFYRSAEWRRTSAAFLATHHECERCGRLATQVHHDPEITTPEGWSRRLDPAILHALCQACHNRMHNRFG